MITRKIILFAALLLVCSPVINPEDGQGPELKQPRENFALTLKQLKVNFENIKDYSCKLESYTSNGKESEQYIYNYYYRKPGLIRMEITDGKKKGTVLIYRDNHVKVKSGQKLLSLVTLNLKCTDRRICDIRGHSIDHSAWGWFISQHLNNLNLFESRCTGDAVVNGRKTTVFELISKNPEDTESIAKETIWVDRSDMIIVKFLLVDKSNRTLQLSTFSNIKLNAGLAENLFIEIKT